MFEIGDTVTVANPGKVYPTYREWMNRYGKESHLWSYDRGYNPITDFPYGKILSRGKHTMFSDMLYCVRFANRVFIFGEEGLDDCSNFC